MIFTAIGTAIAGALFGGSLLAASLIAGTLAFGASLAFSYLKRPKKRSYTAVQGETKYGGDVDVEALYGIGKTKGQRTFYAKWGSGNKVNAEVFVLSDGWCDGLEPYLFIYGERKALTSVAKIGGEAAHYNVAGFGAAISIRFYDGRPGQPVDMKLVNDTAALGSQWKITSINAGKAYVVVERTYDSDIFDKGKPEFEFVLRGLREYDPRKDSTVVGGSGLQRLNDPATWVFTRNPAVHRLNYQLGLRALISGRTLIGEGKTLGQIDLPTYFVAMNVCDTVKKGKPTYQCGLWVTGADDHTEILKEFDDAMAGYGLNRRGLSGVIAGAPQIPVATITSADIDVERSSEIQFRKSAFERFNYLSGQFLSIDDNWNPQSLKPISVNADVAADGRSRQTSNDFLQVTDADIAQYLLTIRYRQNRMGGTATIPVSRRLGLEVQEGEWVTYSGRTWMVSEWSCDESFDITLTLSETSAAIYDDEDIEPGPVIVPPSPPVNPSILSTVQNLTIQVGVIQGAAGFQTPTLRFTWAPPQDPTITEVRFEYRIKDKTTVYTDVSKSPEDGVFETSKDVQSGVQYEGRATITTVPDRFKTWTPWITTVQATSNQSIYVDVNLDGINEMIGWLGGGVRNALDLAYQLTGDLDETSATAYLDKEELRRELTARAGALEASYTEVIQVAVTQIDALAAKTETLSAAMGGSTASVNVRWAAYAGPEGVATRYGIVAAANDGTYRAASFLMDVPIDPEDPTMVMIRSGRFLIISDDDEAAEQPFVFEDGELTLAVANIGTVTAGIMQSLNGKMTINLNAGTIVIRS